jgi:hypothetical protein
VDRADFIAMETLRLFKPSIYTAIRANPERLTGGAVSSANRPARDLASEYDDLLLGGITRTSGPKCASPFAGYFLGLSQSGQIPTTRLRVVGGVSDSYVAPSISRHISDLRLARNSYPLRRFRNS